MFCGNCGAKMPQDAKFCGVCGSQTDTLSDPGAQSQVPVQPSPPPQAYGTQVQMPSLPPQPPVHHPQPGAYSPQPAAGIMSVGQYLGMFLLQMIPLVNIILLFVWSFDSSVNPNKKNLARALLILSAIGIVFSFLAGGIILGILSSILDSVY